MAYPLINGATINGSESGPLRIRPGHVALPVVGVAEAFISMDAVGADAVEVGPARTALGVSPSGVEAVQSGTHAGLYNALIPLYTATEVAAGTALSAIETFSSGAYPTMIGDPSPRVGSDVQVSPSGLGAATSGLHSATAAQPPSTISIQAAGAYPTHIGDVSISLRPIEVTSAGAAPTLLGDLSVGMWFGAAGGDVALIGTIRTSTVVAAASSSPTNVGDVRTVMASAIESMLIATAGVPTVSVGWRFCDAAGAAPLVVGGFGVPYAPVRARQSFPMRLGPIAINRGAAC